MRQKIWPLTGGIHPPQNKIQSTQSAVKQPPIPSKLVLPLQQHIGQPASTLVKIGERVLKGQKIADPSGYVSAAIHAPTSGIVIAIEERPIPHSSGLSDLCIEIKPDNLDEWCKKTPIKNYTETKPAVLLKQIRESGITGMGGAGFPTSVKLNPRDDIAINTLIINAVECEPYITADDMLMRERPDEVIRGINILNHILKPAQILVAIEDNKPEATTALKNAVDKLATTTNSNLKIISIPTKYPSGSEKQLIKILTGLEVPSGGLPADIGVVCQNVATTTSIYKAIELGEPLISRITTMTGNALQQCCNLDVMLGTPIDELLKYTGLQQQKLNRLIIGGPMMGFSIEQTNLPVVKTVNCILATTNTEINQPESEKPCIRCGLCAQACPIQLLPQQLYWHSKAKEFDKTLQYNLPDCIECGCCAYVCPSDIPLVQYYRYAKGQIKQQEQERTKSEHAKLRFNARTKRKERKAAEIKLAREARAKIAAQKTTNKTKPNISNDKTDNKAAIIQAALERANAKKRKLAEQAITTVTNNKK